MTQKIKGYRTLTDEEIALVNEGKELAVKMGEFCDKLKQTPGIDLRWLAIGTTDLQKGYMGVVRSITKPETF